jgi:D-galactarolactone cycloisomerase
LAPLEDLLEFDRSEHPIRQAILSARTEHRRGVMHVPDGPGHGIEIDRDALARFAVHRAVLLLMQGREQTSRKKSK